ncbi:hypothetical protein DBR06_SOUSAS110244 [Sousa chinensis]|uniref:Uncharacterized protein n=1 Tax=Sousa chinensis TaxID=103600 RepID=A0A484GS08_SOUCH|nr:hypothetical protein DBR06_SOUSAS110244 [Sousa chinensis]
MCFSIEFSLVLKMSEKGHLSLAPASSSGWAGGSGAVTAGGAAGASPAPSQRASLRGRPRLPMEEPGSAELVLFWGGAARPSSGPQGRTGWLERRRRRGEEAT